MEESDEEEEEDVDCSTAGPYRGSSNLGSGKDPSVKDALFEEGNHEADMTLSRCTGGKKKLHTNMEHNKKERERSVSVYFIMVYKLPWLV